MSKSIIAVLVAIALGLTACTSSGGEGVRVSQSSGNLQASSTCDSGSYRTESSNEAAPSWLTIEGEVTEVVSSCDDTTLAFAYGASVTADDAKTLKVWNYRDGVWTSLDPKSVDTGTRIVTVSVGRTHAHWAIGWKK